MIALGKLLRLSLGATAAADALAGVLLGAGTWPGGLTPWTQVLGALAVYHGGMALNDWADRKSDARVRPERPIPSGAVAPKQALGIAVTLLIAGPALALIGSPGGACALCAVALAAATYDLAGRGPWLGPGLLAFCRAGNLAAGMLAGASLASGPMPPATPLAWSLPAAYGAYVFLVSRLGRLEDAEDRPTERRPGPRALLVLAALLLLSPAVLPVPGTEATTALRAAAFVLGLLGALGLLRAAGRFGPSRTWQPTAIVPVMGQALRRLLVFSACAALLSGSPHGPIAAAAILAGYPVSRYLRRVFPPS